MAPRREEIHDFVPKMEVLQNVLGLKNNFERFCEVLGVNREGLKACLTDGGTKGLSGDYQRRIQCALIDRLGNFLAWPEWIETDHGRIARGERRDTAAFFLARCNEGLANPSVPSVPLRLIIVDNPLPIVESLGSVELFGTSQFIEGRDATLSGTLICRPANLEGARIAIRFCKLRLKRSPLSIEARNNRKSQVFVPLKNDKGVEVTIQRVGTSQSLTIEVRAARGAIEMVSLPDDLWPIPEALAGHRYEVQLIVYLRDCRLVGEDDDTNSEMDKISPEEGNSFVGARPEKMEHILKLIEARMAELKSLDFEEGYGVLHRFTVELAPVHPLSVETKNERA